MVTIQCTVFDDVLPDALVNVARLHIMPRATNGIATAGRRSLTTGGDDGRGGSGPKGHDGSRRQIGKSQPGGIQMPRIQPVYEAEWESHKFDQYSACSIIEDGTGEADEEQSAYTFYINMDNVYLRTDMKGAADDVAVMEARFKFGVVLVGLAIIHNYRNGNGKDRQSADEGNGECQTLEAKVRGTTKAIAPFLVPMIDYLGSLSSDELSGSAQSGDEE